MTYDKSVDAAYIDLGGHAKPVKTESVSIEGLIPFGDLNIDFGSDNYIAGFEILNASKYLPQSLIEKAKHIG